MHNSMQASLDAHAGKIASHGVRTMPIEQVRASLASQVQEFRNCHDLCDCMCDACMIGDAPCCVYVLERDDR